MAFLNANRKGFLVPLIHVIGATLVFTSCDNPETSFSLNSESSLAMQQATTRERKIDILWVIDNSNSMATSQKKVAENFGLFINGFVSKNYDFQVAVTTTDSWLGDFSSPASVKNFRDGTAETGFTGQPILNREMNDFQSLFFTNVIQGVGGYGDERAFQSMVASLKASSNDSFLRDDAFLAVVIVSDEDDFSHQTAEFLGNDYQDDRLHPISLYVDELKNIKGSESQFSVSAMAIKDQECLQNLQNDFPGRRIGQRYIELATLTGGVVGSLCDDFSQAFNIISDTIIELTNTFQLARDPDPETIEVKVNDEIVAMSSENGWTYDAEKNQIVFHGTAIPNDGDNVGIHYDPIGIKQ